LFSVIERNFRIEKKRFPAHPLLQEEHRPAILQLHSQSDSDQQRRERQHRRARHDHVKQALGDAAAHAQRPDRDLQNAVPARHTRAIGAQFGHRVIDDLARDIGAFQDDAPVGAALDGALTITRSALRITNPMRSSAWGSHNEESGQSCPPKRDRPPAG
jgi:hypothetical protein